MMKIRILKSVGWATLSCHPGRMEPGRTKSREQEFDGAPHLQMVTEEQVARGSL